ncbi:hypothetical protein [Methanococcoides methylutens]|uniref:Uncharacterized protein n=1 Tax=Methanococcoides methylutens MM1 TaxID=1434104 RepID=A0A0E3X1E4_METMT|nr:hypothetical protein [Methanococcoides methylutens]AKB86115.1 hypothetical protein MCMEM_2062 [Methanococcoides methylutens MM1]
MANFSDNKFLIGFTLILALMAYSYYIGQLLTGFLISVLLIVIFFVPVKDIVGPKASKTTTVREELEGEVLGDSRIYEKANSFIGIPIGIVLGKIFGRYESVFTLRSGKGPVIVVYPGVCPVSGGSNVKVSGTWYEGENVGVKGNFVRAERIVDESTDLVFALKK